jgi:hypothetical protein
LCSFFFKGNVKIPVRNNYASPLIRNNSKLTISPIPNRYFSGELVRPDRRLLSAHANPLIAAFIYLLRCAAWMCMRLRDRLFANEVRTCNLLSKTTTMVIDNRNPSRFKLLNLQYWCESGVIGFVSHATSLENSFVTFLSC